MHILYDKGAEVSASQDVIEQVVKTTPTAGVAAVAWFSPTPVADWAAWIAIVYGLLQIYILVRDRIIAPWRAKRDSVVEKPDGSAGQA